MFRIELISLGLFFAICNAMEIKYAPCTGELKPTSKISSVTLDPCEQLPCHLTRGETYAINMTFAPTQESNKLTAKVAAHVGPLFIPYNLPSSDACESHGLTCPLNPGSEQVYQYGLQIPTMYPGIKTVIRWELLNENNNNVVCVLFPLDIV